MTLAPLTIEDLAGLQSLARNTPALPLGGVEAAFAAIE